MKRRHRRSAVQAELIHLWSSRRGGQLVGYVIMTGLVAIACVVAVGHFNGSTEKAIESHTERASVYLANADPGTTLGEEVAKAVAEDTATGLITSAITSPGVLAAGAFRRRSSRNSAERDLPATECKGGSCTTGQCFVKGTLVLTPTGYRPIEDIRVGDLVLAPSEPFGDDAPAVTAISEEISATLTAGPATAQ